jgi:hypothetical protein
MKGTSYRIGSKRCLDGVFFPVLALLHCGRYPFEEKLGSLSVQWMRPCVLVKSVTT